MNVFEKKFMELPMDSPVRGKLEWMASHPAMTRLARRKDDKRVILRAEDIVDAPSRAAVTQLQAFVNRPEAFFAQIMSLQMKELGLVQQIAIKNSSVEPNPLEEEVDSEAVKRMMKLLGGEEE